MAAAATDRPREGARYRVPGATSALFVMPIRFPCLVLPAALMLAAPCAGAQQGPAPTTPEPVYFEFQVENPAELAPGSCSPGIPRKVTSNPSRQGEVQVQFVVDTTGRADKSTVKVLLATHTELEEAVRKAIPCMRFRAATIDGRPVRQLVQQPFAFVLPR